MYQKDRLSWSREALICLCSEANKSICSVGHTHDAPNKTNPMCGGLASVPSEPVLPTLRLRLKDDHEAQ